MHPISQGIGFNLWEIEATNHDGFDTIFMLRAINRIEHTDAKPDRGQLARRPRDYALCSLVGWDDVEADGQM